VLEYVTRDGYVQAVVADACMGVLNAVLSSNHDDVSSKLNVVIAKRLLMGNIRACVYSGDTNHVADCTFSTTLRHRALGCALNLLRYSVTHVEVEQDLLCGFLSSATFVVYCRHLLDSVQHCALLTALRYGLRKCNHVTVPLNLGC
jgi:hypothetical protein